MIDAARARVWRAYADTRRVLTRGGSASSATRAVGGRGRVNQSEWTARLAARHGAYRRAVDPVSGRVAIVCVSSRPHRLDAVVEAVRCQAVAPRELVFVTNSDLFDSVDVESALAPLRRDRIRVVVLRRPADRSLGACLNDAMDATDARFVAKFDDDDLYGPNYLADALRAHSYSGAAVVGKHTYYAYLAPEDRTVLRFPANEFSYSSTLAGGTLVVDRALLGDLGFPDISLGEDRGLIAACHRRGLSTFSADRFNFVQVRSSDNTWTIGRDDFVSGAVDVADGLATDVVDI
jgi:glycosyltransferase involved in cell wall biosynthesis